jgi:hypothetical protein
MPLARECDGGKNTRILGVVKSIVKIFLPESRVAESNSASAG